MTQKRKIIKASPRRQVVGIDKIPEREIPKYMANFRSKFKFDSGENSFDVKLTTKKEVVRVKNSKGAIVLAWIGNQANTGRANTLTQVFDLNVEKTSPNERWESVIANTEAKVGAVDYLGLGPETFEILFHVKTNWFIGALTEFFRKGGDVFFFPSDLWQNVRDTVERLYKQTNTFRFHFLTLDETRDHHPLWIATQIYDVTFSKRNNENAYVKDLSKVYPFVMFYNRTRFVNERAAFAYIDAFRKGVTPEEGESNIALRKNETSVPKAEPAVAPLYVPQRKECECVDFDPPDSPVRQGKRPRKYGVVQRPRQIVKTER